MTNSQRQSKARQCFLHWLTLQNELTPNQSIIREGMVIREDFFLGRRFVTEAFDAIWFIEEDQLKVFGTDGSVLAVMDKTAIDDCAIKYQKEQEEHSGENHEVRRAA